MFQKTDPVQEAPKPDQAFMHQREAAVNIYITQAAWLLAFVATIWFLTGVKSQHYLTFDLFINALIAGLVAGGLYFVIRLWKWDALTTKVNGGAVSVITENTGKRPTMYIRLERPSGDTDVADFGVPEAYRHEIVIIARRALHGASTSQLDMQKTFKISRGHWQSIIAAFVQANVLQKENPNISNSKYVFCEPEDENRAVMQAIVDGDFDMLDEVWK